VAENQEAVFEGQRFQFRQNVPLGSEQEADGTLAGREVADIAGEHGVQVAKAIGTRQGKDGTEIGVHEADVLAGQAMPDERIAELRRQRDAEKRLKFSAGGEVFLGERSSHV
jgi:hypothetical protein